LERAQVGGALAIGVADKIFMLENSIYSILSPEGYASILWKDSSRAKEAASIMKPTADDLYEFKVIDKVIKEPENGGAVNDIIMTSDLIKKEIVKAIKELKTLDTNELVNLRYKKFRNMGEYIGG
jgi:acetyl-CoA carboxylase carboxyl transferase subunit alpha